MNRVSFALPHLIGKEALYLNECLLSGQWGGDASFTKRCHAHLDSMYDASTLLCHSCTAALEMAAMLLRLGPGDEVIMPSFTFVSTANAVVLRGAVPVFVDIRSDTLNIDETLIEAAITPRTKAIFVVHYAGVGCEMEPILAIASRHGLAVVEDAAQAYLASWKGRALGTFGQLATLSFHQTKNIVSGEGGALIINDPALVERAQVIREKGTNRSQFIRGEVAKYDWQDMGSSFLPSDLVAAVLLAQLEYAEDLTRQRLSLWHAYDAIFKAAGHNGLRLPEIPADAAHNGHIYHLRFANLERREETRRKLVAEGIGGVTHYVPLHSSPAGERYGLTPSSMAVTNQTADTLLRLPLHGGLTEADIARVASRVLEFAQ
ncbi:DegT/DnrJ/EryC1/StrS family aminotransferase protein [Rhizobium sp. CIAT894]|uniref:dTDP-4-amino-4,6-dideoxygalactose transaminase n=1 Tax=Rhizobium sp. CIAT894 TaxID=2020312 RepID=UPI000A1DB386|nr:dTDP-4-amino-4,6-dideoxygalactose transaminase [Rhizobium sp. CIAT894]ARM87425.1 DegT/DnrJ/EryC1/StrS family aminotransferase protein [Rhizobium sp. CIAT894]